MPEYNNIISARKAATVSGLIPPTTQDSSMDAIYAVYEQFFYDLFKKIHESAEKGEHFLVFHAIENSFVDDGDLNVREAYKIIEDLEDLLALLPVDSSHFNSTKDAIASMSTTLRSEVMAPVSDIQRFLHHQGYKTRIHQPLKEFASEFTLDLHVSWGHFP